MCGRVVKPMNSGRKNCGFEPRYGATTFSLSALSLRLSRLRLLNDLSPRVVDSVSSLRLVDLVSSLRVVDSVSSPLNDLSLRVVDSV